MYKVRIDNKEFNVEFDKNSPSKGSVNGKEFNLDIIKIKTDIYHLIMNNESYHIEIIDIDYNNKKLEIKIRDNKYTLDIHDDLDELLHSMGISNNSQVKINELKAPMPGLVLNILVEEGSSVTKEDKLLVLEAMKMENNIKSPTDGIIKKIKCKKGLAVEKNEVLIVFE